MTAKSIEKLEEQLSDTEQLLVATQNENTGLMKQLRVECERSAFMQQRMRTLEDACQILVPRAGCSAVECDQLQIGRLIGDGLDDHGKLKWKLIPFSDDDPLIALAHYVEGDRATRAAMRIIKKRFVAHQAMVADMLMNLDTICRGNIVTGEDIRKLRQLRNDLQERAALGFDVLPVADNA